MNIIQDIINNIVSTNGTYDLLLKGTYTVDSDIVIPSGFKLEGDGSAVIDFNHGNYGIVIGGSTGYSTGTITSITGGVNVVGSGTSWLANVTPYVSQLFINGQTMIVGAVLTDTTLTLLEGYDGPGFAPGNSYQIAAPNTGVTLSNFTIINSTGSAIKINNARNINFDKIILQSNNIGIEGNYVTEFNMNSINSILNTSHGISITNGGRFNWSSVNSVANGGSGVVFNDVRSAGFSEGVANSNTANGFSYTNCYDISIYAADASSNGAKGIECVSGNTSMSFIDIGIRGNISDGLKLTASTNGTKISGCDLQYNGGYGIDIASSTSNITILVSNTTANNTSGGLSDSGTGTLKSATVNSFA